MDYITEITWLKITFQEKRIRHEKYKEHTFNSRYWHAAIGFGLQPE